MTAAVALGPMAAERATGVLARSAPCTAHALSVQTRVPTPACMHACPAQLIAQHMDWMLKALKRRRAGLPPQAPARPRAPVAAAVGDASATQQSPVEAPEEDILTRWLAVEDGPDDDFLASLEDFTLETWDHRTHLRWGAKGWRRGGQRAGLHRAGADVAASCRRELHAAWGCCNHSVAISLHAGMEGLRPAAGPPPCMHAHPLWRHHPQACLPVPDAPRAARGHVLHLLQHQGLHRKQPRHQAQDRHHLPRDHDLLFHAHGALRPGGHQTAGGCVGRMSGSTRARAACTTSVHAHSDAAQGVGQRVRFYLCPKRPAACIYKWQATRLGDG